MKTLLDELGTVRYIKEVQIVESTKTHIRKTFPEDPELMVAIATCESGLRQFDTEGNVIVSPTKDFGIFQINEKTWHNTAESLELDYKNSEEDNIEMARHIFEVQGINAWVCYTKHIAQT